MSMNNLSVDGEFRYIIQWFNEWSELQREDFVPVLVEYLTQGDGATNDGVYMNGVVNSIANAGLNDRPMSLFQCRIKLFRQWTPKWPNEFKYKLKEKIIEIDTKVGEKIINEIKGPIEHHHTNGNAAVNGVEVEDEQHRSDVINAAVAIVEETEEAINADSRMQQNYNNNETSVDDDIVYGEDQQKQQQQQTISSNDIQTVAIAVANTNDDTYVEPAEQVQMPTQEHVAEVSLLA